MFQVAYCKIFSDCSIRLRCVLVTSVFDFFLTEGKNKFDRLILVFTQANHDGLPTSSRKAQDGHFGDVDGLSLNELGVGGTLWNSLYKGAPHV